MKNKNSEIARYLFKSLSCYPLSPSRESLLDHNKEDHLDSSDHLNMILHVLGDQHKSDISFLSSKHSMKYVLQHSSGNQKIKFDKEFVGTDEGLIRVLESCLQFNPYFRHPAELLLKSACFDDIKIGQCN